MFKLLAFLCALIVLGSTIAWNENRTPNAAPAAVEAAPEKLAPFPNISFKTVGGEKLRVQDMKEKIILVHFWAAWCAPCQKEFPALLKYVQQSQGRVALIAIAIDDHYQDSQKFINRLTAKNPVLMHDPHIYWVWDSDKNLSAKMFNTVKVPETILVNEKRQMADKIIGEGPWAEAATGKAISR
jgi:thiol-disulfide isomerase/thioredoxin